MELFIITGTTKGLGHALMNKALENGHFVLSLSRKKVISHKNLIHLTMNLSKPTLVEKKLHHLDKLISFRKFNSVHLINNAAQIEPIGLIEDQNSKSIIEHLNCNLITPIILTKFFLHKFKQGNKQLNIINISSGAATLPLLDWSLYCSGKSGLRMFTECLDQDYKIREKIRFLDFSPGVMDTSMQTTIRNQHQKNFRKINDFKDLKTNNKLLSPELVANAIIELLKDQNKITKTHYSISEFI